jgi:hypothetical protein
VRERERERGEGREGTRKHRKWMENKAVKILRFLPCSVKEMETLTLK